MEKYEVCNVVSVIDEYTVVISRGSDNGIKDGMEFIVYYLGQELHDIDTGESLGNLEVVCGKAKIKHIQPKITTLVSNEYEHRTSRRIIKDNSVWAAFPSQTTEEIEPIDEQLPFEDIKQARLAKRIK